MRLHVTIPHRRKLLMTIAPLVVVNIWLACFFMGSDENASTDKDDPPTIFFYPENQFQPNPPSVKLRMPLEKRRMAGGNIDDRTNENSVKLFDRNHVRPAIVEGMRRSRLLPLMRARLSHNALHLVTNPEASVSRVDDSVRKHFFKRSERINNFKAYTYLSKAEDVCEGLEQTGDIPSLVFLVTSSPDHEKQRDSIRKTWGSYAKNGTLPFRVVFHLGRPPTAEIASKIKAEYIEHRDIVSFDFVDSYRNLSLKVVLSLRWVTEYCQQAEFYAKTDDDMYFNIFNVMRELSYSERTGLISGYNIGGGPVVRRGRWNMTKEAYPFAIMPSYIAGNAYVMSRDVLQKIYSVADYVPFLPIEDLYVTGVLAKIAKCPLQHNPTFPEWNDLGRSNFHMCMFIKGKKIALHKLSPERMIYMWQNSNMTCKSWTKMSKMRVPPDT